MRAFFGIPVEESHRAGLAAAQEDLRASGADVTWVRPESLHLTLKFLGEVDDGVRLELKSGPPFDLEIAEVGEFSKKIVWAGCRGALRPLNALVERLEEAGERVGVPRETRRFSPHITIGRIRSKRNLAGLRCRMARWKDRVFGPWPVRRILLFRSETSPNGSVYKVVAEYPCTEP